LKKEEEEKSKTLNDFANDFAINKPKQEEKK
jgi:hypothetical protein